MRLFAISGGTGIWMMGLSSFTVFLELVGNGRDIMRRKREQEGERAVDEFLINSRRRGNTKLYWPRVVASRKLNLI